MACKPHHSSIDVAGLRRETEIHFGQPSIVLLTRNEVPPRINLLDVIFRREVLLHLHHVDVVPGFSQQCQSQIFSFELAIPRTRPTGRTPHRAYPHTTYQETYQFRTHPPILGKRINSAFVTDFVTQKNHYICIFTFQNHTS